jgi:hypothetical protein
MFLHCHFHKFAWTSDEKTQSDWPYCDM